MKHSNIIKTKLFASGIHFSISFVIFTAMALWFCLSLYPSFYFKMSGGIQGLLLMLFCDVVLGPFLALIVFNPRKPKREIITDLSVIALVQLAAFIYGFYTVYQGRPYLTVLYKEGNATVLPYRDVREDFPNLSKQRIQGFAKFKGVHISAYHGKFMKLSETPEEFIKAVDESTRLAIAKKPNVQKQLEALEKQYGELWCMTFLGKYTGAYIITNKQFEFIDKIGEEDMTY